MGMAARPLRQLFVTAGSGELRRDQDMGSAHQDHREDQPHSRHPITEVLRCAAHAKGVAETAKQQGTPQQMNQLAGMIAGFDEIDEQQG